MSSLSKTPFFQFLLKPTGASVVIQIGIYICLLFMLSQIRNILQQFASYNNCDIIPNANIFDYSSIVFDLGIAGVSAFGLYILVRQLNAEFTRFKQGNS